VCFSNDNKYIASGSGDNTVRLWDVETGNELRCFEGHADNVSSVCFTNDNKSIVSVSQDKTIRMWDIKTGNELRCFEGHEYDFNSLCLSNDNKYIVSKSDDYTVRLWDVKTGKELCCFEGHEYDVKSVRFSNDNKYIVSVSGDNTVRLWDIKTGKEIYKIYNLHGEWVCITPDKYFSCSENGRKFISQRFSDSFGEISDKAYKKYHRPDIIRQRVEALLTPEYETENIHQNLDEIPEKPEYIRDFLSEDEENLLDIEDLEKNNSQNINDDFADGFPNCDDDIPF
jgi:WD40 repeat protein